MAQQKYKIGHIAAKILLEAIENDTKPEGKIILDTKLIKRKSVKNISRT